MIVLRAAGVNCDQETLHAWRLVGLDPQSVHVRRLIERPRELEQCEILTIPGGFSYGDDISAGRLLARQIERELSGAILALIERGGLVLGICNGFQALVKAGLLPGPLAAVGAGARRAGSRACEDRTRARRGDAGGPATLEPRNVTITENRPAGFQDRWVTLLAQDTPCAFVEPGRRYEMPIAHGEGRVRFRDEASERAANELGRCALTYVASAGAPTDAARRMDSHSLDEPANPNDSDGDVAGLCDETGRVLGLMPHPERFVSWTQHPCWTSLPERTEGDGLALFRNAARRFE